MAPIGSKHAAAVNRLIRLLAVLAGDRVYLSVQNPIVLGDESEPEPDFALATLPESKYAAAHPRPGDILLVIEVADTTLEYDRKVKLPLYAEHGIPEAWLVDLTAKQLEIHLQPSPDGYRQILRPARDAVVAPAFAQDARINLAELFA
jgi:Uma2 family endonuclease